VVVEMKFKKGNKRAQMEMAGLVVIVILITLGMLFMAQFAMKDDGKKKIFTRKGLAYSAMGGFMKVSINDSQCSPGYIGSQSPRLGKELIEDCANNPSGVSDSIYNCRGLHTCEFLQQFITEQLNETLGVWGRDYIFTSKLIIPDTENVVKLFDYIKGGNGCPKWKDRDGSGLFPIHTGSGLVENELYLC